MADFSSLNGYNVKDSVAREQLNLINNKKILVIGDSYTGQTFPDITKFWWQNFRDYLELQSGTNLFVNGVPGYGFANDGFYNILVQYGTTLMSEQQRQELTDIFIVGGWNDRTATETTLLSKMTTFNNYAKQNFPNAKITLAYVGHSNPVLRQTPENGVGSYTALMSYINNAGKLGWKYIKNSQYILHNYNSSYWEDDGVHPSQNGQDELGIQLTLGFINGVCDIQRQNINQFIEANASGITSSMSNNQFFSGIANEISYLSKYVQNSQFYLDINNTSMSLTGDTKYEIMTIDDGYVVGANTNCKCSIPIIVQCTVNEQSVRVTGYADIIIQYGVVSIKPLAYYNNQALQNVPVKYIFMPNFTINVSSQIA